jgi:ribosomal protein S18 acetylase RimI-like enzyme
VPIPEHVLRSWRALDASFAHVTPTPWGAVVTDGRFPRIWDANYARIDRPARGVRAADVEAALRPALAAAGAEVLHVVSFRPEETHGLLAELSARGHRLTWDLVMDVRIGSPGPAPGPDAVVVTELAPGPELWDRVEASLGEFGVEPAEAVRQLRTLEAEVLAPGGKRWFGVREGAGPVVSLGALLLLEGVGYLDNVVSFPAWRGRGYATAVTRRIVAEAGKAGAAHVWLLADPDDEPVARLYRRLGFRDVGMLASTRGPLGT